MMALLPIAALVLLWLFVQSWRSGKSLRDINRTTSFVIAAD